MSYYLDGKRLPPDTPFEHDGIVYPANWLSLSTQADRDAIGIVWEDDPATAPNTSFYTVVYAPDGSVQYIPKDVDVCRDEMISQNKRTAYQLLQPTDWMVVRQADGVPMDPAIDAYRVSVRTASNDNEATLNACTTLEELAAYVPVWPEPPEEATKASR